MGESGRGGAGGGTPSERKVKDKASGNQLHLPWRCGCTVLTAAAASEKGLSGCKSENVASQSKPVPSRSENGFRWTASFGHLLLLRPFLGFLSTTFLFFGNYFAFNSEVHPPICQKPIHYLPNV